MSPNSEGTGVFSIPDAASTSRARGSSYANSAHKKRRLGLGFPGSTAKYYSKQKADTK